MFRTPADRDAVLRLRGWLAVSLHGFCEQDRAALMVVMELISPLPCGHSRTAARPPGYPEDRCWQCDAARQAEAVLIRERDEARAQVQRLRKRIWPNGESG
jgi:hypothetical protein